MEIREIAEGIFPDIYQTYIVNDFARDERRPLKAIQKLYKQHDYIAYGLYDGEELRAYACFIKKTGVSGVLLDYFAVVSGKRGGGIGSLFLTEVKKKWECGGIIIESEMPEMAADDADREIRERRIRFYQKNGAELSNIGWKTFGVDYNLLWLPINTCLADIDLAAQIQEIYGHALPRFIMKRMTKVYLLEK